MLMIIFIGDDDEQIEYNRFGKNIANQPTGQLFHQFQFHGFEFTGSERLTIENGFGYIYILWIRFVSFDCLSLCFL